MDASRDRLIFRLSKMEETLIQERTYNDFFANSMDIDDYTALVGAISELRDVLQGAKDYEAALRA